MKLVRWREQNPVYGISTINTEHYLFSRSKIDTETLLNLQDYWDRLGKKAYNYYPVYEQNAAVYAVVNSL